MTTEEIISLTKKLIGFESIESKPDQLCEVIDFVEDYLKKNTKLELKRFEVNGKHSLVGFFEKKTSSPKKSSFETPKVIFHDHLDVVPGRPEQFKPFIKGGKLFGRGASDTKANGAVLMVLAKELSNQLNANRSTLNAPSVAFMFTTDEEVSGYNGTRHLLNQGYRCEFFITCEPTHFDIIPAHKGILWLKVGVKGKASHASRPWNGQNAALLAHESLEKLYKLYPLPQKEAWKTTINLGGVAGGDAFNKVMAECELKLDIRFIEKDKPEKIIKDVRQCFPGAEVTVVENEPKMETSFGNHWVKKLASSVKRIVGRDPEIRKGHGACDGRFYSAVGIPAVEFGTVSNGLHTDEEYVKISSLPTFYKILWNFVSDI